MRAHWDSGLRRADHILRSLAFSTSNEDLCQLLGGAVASLGELSVTLGPLGLRETKGDCQKQSIGTS